MTAFEMTPLGYLARIRAGQSPASEVVTDLAEGGTPFVQGNAEFGTLYPNPRFACDAAPKVAPAGAILVSVRAPVGALNVAATRLGIGRGLAAIVPSQERLHTRYLWWSMQAMMPALRSAATGSTYEAVTATDIFGWRLPNPSLEVQRRIADHLDAETARIDALIAKNATLDSLLGERFRSVVEGLFQRADRRVPLRYLLRRRPTYGILKPRAVDAGVPVLRITDITAAGGVTRGSAIKVPAVQSAEYSRTVLEPGDVVVSVVGTLGRAAVIDDAVAGANISRALARLVPAGVSGPWLVRWIQSADFERMVDEVTAGTAQRVLNMEDLVEFRVPVYTDPTAPTAQLEEAQARTATTRSTLARQRGLLLERRQALITAAVTGQIEV